MSVKRLHLSRKATTESLSLSAPQRIVRFNPERRTTCSYRASIVRGNVVCLGEGYMWCRCQWKCDEWPSISYQHSMVGSYQQAITHIYQCDHAYLCSFVCFMLQHPQLALG